MAKRSVVVLAICSSLACQAEVGDEAESAFGDFADEIDTDDGDTTAGDGDTTAGDGDTTTAGDGDGDTTTAGDGDGDTTTTTTTGDGDGDPTTGDGDGDTSPCTANDPGWPGFAQVGQPAPHFSGTNQYGEEVSICAYEGLPIVIDTSAVWCGPCQMLSICLGGDDNTCLQLFGGDPQVLTYLVHPLREEIDAGTFGWVTVLTENYNSGPPALSDAQAWDQSFPVNNVWVIPDVEQKYYGHLQIAAFPSVWLIDTQMNWEDLDQATVFTTIISKL